MKTRRTRRICAVSTALTLLLLVVMGVRAGAPHGDAQPGGSMHDSPVSEDETVASLRAQLVALGISPDREGAITALSREATDTYSKLICLLYLGHVGSVSDSDLIWTFATSEDPRVRFEAINSIGLILSREDEGGGEDLLALRSELVEAATDLYESAETLLDSIETAALLCRLGDASGGAVVHKALGSRDSGAVGFALGHVRCFVDHASESGNDVVDWVAALSRVATDTSAPATQRVPAVQCLLQLDSDEARATLARVAEVEPEDSSIGRLVRSSLSGGRSRSE